MSGPAILVLSVAAGPVAFALAAASVRGRGPLAVLASIGYVAAAAGSWVVGVIVGFSCDGDGGSPYAAPASPRGQLCSAIDHPAIFVLIILLPLVPALVMGWHAIRRGRPRLALVGFAVAVGLAGGILAVDAVLPAHCGESSSARGTDACAHY